MLYQITSICHLTFMMYKLQVVSNFGERRTTTLAPRFLGVLYDWCVSPAFFLSFFFRRNYRLLAIKLISDATTFCILDRKQIVGQLHLNLMHDLDRHFDLYVVRGARFSVKGSCDRYGSRHVSFSELITIKNSSKYF